MTKEDIIRYRDDFLFIVFLLFLFSVVFSLRAISSISIGLILAIGLAKNPRIFNQLFYNKAIGIFLMACSLLFILQCFALSYTTNISEGLKLLQRTSGIIFIPFAVFANHEFLREKYQKISFYFAAILCVGSLYCLLVALSRYISGAPFSIFFYHDLVKPLQQHAIQFSIMVFIASIFLAENFKHSQPNIYRLLSRLMTAFLSIILVLLSSKLVISMYVFYLLYFFLNKKIHKSRSKVLIPVFIITVAITITTLNPVGNRFREMLSGNSMLFTRDKFSPGIYFNGIQFRLLQWRFTYEILAEQKAWFTGTTAGDAQSFLDKKYLQTNMYTGISGTSNRGFLGYHTHNQFLQTLLENGLPALLLFLFICFSLSKMAMKSKSKEPKWLVLLLLIYCFTDAPLETQYGIVIFTFFPLFLCMADTLLIPTKISLKRSSGTVIKTIALEQPN